MPELLDCSRTLEMKLPISCLLAIFLVAAVNAGFWDDLVSTVSEKVNQGAEFVQKKALPAISDGFENVKTSIQESEFPDKIHSWAKDVRFYC